VTSLDVERIDGVPVVHVKEDIDAANVAATQEALADALGPDALSLVVDLSETRYVDSAGIDMLLRLGERLDQSRARLIVVIPEDSQLRRLVKIVGLPQAIAIRGDVAEALQDAASPKRQLDPTDPRPTG
jgi:anti-anti-sigma factor